MTDRPLTRIPEVVDALEDLWREYPNQRLTQLIFNITSDLGRNEWYNLEDDQLLERIKRGI